MPTIKEEHGQKVAHIAEKIKFLKSIGIKPRIFRGSNNSTRHFEIKSKEVIDITGFKKILEIDVKNGYIVVEPNVTMGDLVKATLPLGLVPPVVMEFPDISTGGAFQGGAGESSSFRYGLFHQIVSEIELVNGAGLVVKLDPVSSPEVFFGVACTYGSLGVLTKLKIKLIKARSFVRIDFHFCNSFNEALNIFKKLSIDGTCDFIDSIFFQKTSGVVMAGYMSSENNNASTYSFNNSRCEWFYSFVHKKIINKELNSIYVPLEDYLFRYNWGGFWIAKYFFKFLRIPFNSITFRIFNKFLYAKNLLKSLQAANYSQKFLVQDFCLPFESSEQYFNFLDNNYNIYPLWICPISRPKAFDKFSPAYISSCMVLNFGSYKILPKNIDYLEYNRNLEIFSSKIGGRKVLYAHNYYSENEFWKLYDEKLYKKLRTFFYAEDVFDDMYHKTYVAHKYKTNILKGFIKLFFGI